MQYLRQHIFITAAVAFYVVATAIFIVIKTTERREVMLMDIDKTLMQAAMSLPLLLPEKFHHKDMHKDSVSVENDMKNIRLLSDIVNTSDLVYLYTMIQKDGKIYFTSSSGTEEEIRTGVNLAHYFYEYDDAAPGLYDVFRTQKRAFLEYTDKWGTFRSVFIPLTASDGAIYVVAADSEISFIREKTRNILAKGTFESIFNLLILFPFFIAYKLHYRQINQDLDRQIKERTNELEESNEKLNKLAITDFLTDIHNRRYFFMMAEKFYQMAHRDGRALSLLMLDIDYFKQVNDSYGHQVGDEVLVLVTDVIRKNLRKADLLGRVGGEELAILLLETDQTGAAVIAEKLRIAIEEAIYKHNDVSINVTASIGCTEIRDTDTELSNVYERADKLLYQAKKNGRNNVMCG